MARTDDIRAWGAENGFDVTGDRLPSGLRAAYDSRSKGDDEPTVVLEEKIEERAPSIARPSTADRVRGLARKARENAPRTKARKPRVSTSKVISKAWTMLSAATATWNQPMSRVFAMQAPVAGMVLEDIVRNTVVDTLLQPLARVSDGGEVALALLGPPLLVGALTMRPDQADKIVPMLRGALRSWIDVAGDKMSVIQQQEEEFEEKYGQKIDEMIGFILAPMTTANDQPS